MKMFAHRMISLQAICFAANTGSEGGPAAPPAADPNAGKKTSEIAAPKPPEGSTALSTVSSETKQVTLANGKVMKFVQSVSRPTLTHDSGVTLFLKILAPFRSDKNQDDKDIHISTVLNLDNDRDYNYVLNAITVSELNDNYPNESYVGKCFAISKGDVVAGKRYKSIAIMEFALEDPEAETKPEDAKS